MTDYLDFLAGKRIAAPTVGVNVSRDAIHPMLFPHQVDLTWWALRKGRAAIFAEPGLGKTFMQLEWARLIDVPTIIVAPLSVARQTIREAEKIDISVQYVRSQSEVTGKIVITNYEMIRHFDAGQFGAVVLDESS